MSSPLVKSRKIMKRIESKKSHSWWWDSHISPKNSKWLAENLEKMDENVKRMLKLIEEDGESFAKKAEMYFQSRPELINLVEEFYRMYRSLAERYDQVTGELRRSIPSDLQSQGSGISDVGPETRSTHLSHDKRQNSRKSGPRAVGFDVFLGSGGSGSDFGNKEGDDSSTLDSESDSDDSSVNSSSGISGDGNDQALHRRIIELEAELHDVQEKLQMQKEGNPEDPFPGTKNENSDDFLSKISGYEEELRIAKEKILLAEEEIVTLRFELQKYESSEMKPSKHDAADKDVKTLGSTGLEEKQATEVQMKSDGFEAEISDAEYKIRTLEEELIITREKLHDSEQELANLRHELENNRSTIQHLQCQLGSARKDISIMRMELDNEKREVSKLQDRIIRYKTNLSDRDEEIRGLKETISNANKSFSKENSELQAEITILLMEKTYLEHNMKEWDLCYQSMEEDVRHVKDGKTKMENVLRTEIEHLRMGIFQKDTLIEELNKTLDTFKLKYDMMVAQRDELNAKVATLVSEMSSKDGQIDEMNKHLHQLHMEHVQLISGMEAEQKLAMELKSKVKELEGETERQEEMIREGAEEKREAIRQLCFSLEHYRNGYHMLRQAFVGHKRVPVMTS